MSNAPLYGWFDSPTDSEPAYDPGRDAPCLICLQPWTPETVRTISAHKLDDAKSYFYRVHRSCDDELTAEQKIDLDGSVLEGSVTS